MEAMLLRGAKAEAKNNNGATPLELAAMYPPKEATIAVLKKWRQTHAKQPEVLLLLWLPAREFHWGGRKPCTPLTLLWCAWPL